MKEIVARSEGDLRNAILSLQFNGATMNHSFGRLEWEVRELVCWLKWKLIFCCYFFSNKCTRNYMIKGGIYLNKLNEVFANDD